MITWIRGHLMDTWTPHGCLGSPWMAWVPRGCRSDYCSTQNVFHPVAERSVLENPVAGYNEFSETQFPVREILGNRASGIKNSRKLGFRCTEFSETQSTQGTTECRRLEMLYVLRARDLDVVCYENRLSQSVLPTHVRVGMRLVIA